MSVPSQSRVRGSLHVTISGPVFQVWVLSICLLATLGSLEVEAAKGSLRAGVLSRSERMRVLSGDLYSFMQRWDEKKQEQGLWQ